MSKNILITGATGSLGKTLIKQLVKHCNRLVIFSRDELKQSEMMKEFPPVGGLRYFVGNVRDKDRLVTALKGIDTVIHGAALKQVPSCEYNPGEAIATNIQGTMNVVNACNEAGVKKCMIVSTDKAVNPVNLYGATKLAAEKYAIAANNTGDCRFSVVRYGNVIGSRGSVLPIWSKLYSEGKPLPITDKRMTRFWITIEEAAKFVIRMVKEMRGGEIFIPKIESARIMDTGSFKNAHWDEIGIRPGEKLHEALLNEDEVRHCYENEKHYTVYPSFHEWTKSINYRGVKVDESFRLTSEI